MAIPDKKIYPRTNDYQTVYLNGVIINPNIIVGDYTIYNDFVSDPLQFEKNNVLYHYPINNDKLIIGNFTSIACGAKFIFTSANHTMRSLSTYTFPLFYEEWVWIKKTSLPHGTTKGILLSAMMCGLAMKPLFYPGSISVTALLSEPGPL